MDPYHQQTYTTEPAWQYDEPCTSFASGAPGIAFACPADNGHYAVEQMEDTTYLEYVTQQPGQQAANASMFRMPSLPASACASDAIGRRIRQQPAGSDDASRRDKTKRIRTACEECRKRKQKCDGGEPCHPCSEQSTQCHYRDVPPTKKDDTMDKMLQLAETYNKTLAGLTSDIDAMSTTLRSIEQRLERTWRAGSDVSTDSAVYLHSPCANTSPRSQAQEQCDTSSPIAASKKRRQNPSASSRPSSRQ